MSLWSWPADKVTELQRQLKRRQLLAAERHFAHALEAPGRAQAELLQHMLRQQAACAYGRDHHFADIGGMRDYQRRVPVVDAATLAPYLTQHRQGVPAVLSVEAELTLSQANGQAGSHAAEKKSGAAGPATAAGSRPAVIGPAWPPESRLGQQVRAALAPWWGSWLRAMPELSHQPVGRLTETGPLAAGVAHPSRRDGANGMPGGEVSAPAPGALAWRAACAARARALLQAENLGVLWASHSGQLAGLLEGLVALGESGQPLGAAASPHRQQAVGEALAAAGGPQAQALWPRLRAVACPNVADVWTRPALAHFLAGLQVAPGPLATPEAVLTAPLWRDAQPAPLAVTSHVFEFLDLQTHGGSPARGLPLLPEELRPGGIYLPVITTFGGLYRFQLRQAVACTGFLGRTPLLEAAGHTRPRQPLGEGSIADFEIRALLAAAAAEAKVAYDFAICTFRVAPSLGLRLFIDSAADDDALLALSAAWEALFSAQLGYRLGAMASAGLPLHLVRVRRGWQRWAEATHSQGRDPWHTPAQTLDADSPWAMVFADQMPRT